MEPYNKLVLQYILVAKALDLAEVLPRIKRPTLTIQFGGESPGTKVSGTKHTFRDIRAACYDLRLLYIKNDPLRHASLGGLTGPMKSNRNKTLRELGLRMIREVAPREVATDSLLRPDLPHSVITEDGSIEENESSGYVHNVGDVATAFLYGQWAHTTKAMELIEMLSGIGRDEHFYKLSGFAYTAGHGFLAVALSFCYEQIGREAPEVSLDPGKGVEVSIRSARNVFRKVLGLLDARITKHQAARPATTHVFPF